MAVNVEILEKLERKMTLMLPVETIRDEVDARLRKLARSVRMDGFRPGKVPLAKVTQQYGHSVQYEVMNDKVSQAFFSAADEANLRVAGPPAISEKEDAPEGQMAFDAVFEVLPEVKIGDLSSAEVERVSVDVDENAIDRTIEILRKQRCTYAQRAKDAGAEEGDRVTVDFVGKVEGEPFAGGQAEGFRFVVGDGQMLKEFEDAVRGMKAGESKTFPLVFPADYRGKEVAGKAADFMVTVTKVEATHLPEVNEQFIKSLGVKDGTLEALRADIRKNVEREVKASVNTRNRRAVMDALLLKAELDLPKASVQAEMERMVRSARADLKARGMKNVDHLPIPEDTFRPQAERHVRLGFVLAELRRSLNLQAKPEQVRAQVEELAASYEMPVEVVRHYYEDKDRLATVEMMVLENNITDYVLSQAKVTERKLDFDELMVPRPA
ncbi:MAG: trigger factor [Burkholderiaceae bacterium]|jgi:trigger factor|nr:trigger factor [Burkholderiaceae bacterium]